MENIINFWFPNKKFQKFWFDNTKDNYIINTFTVLLKEVGSQNIDIIKKTDDEILQYIILFDQFSRHIYRNNRSSALFIKYNNKALEYSLYFLKERFNYNIHFNYLIFLLMPLRHSKNIEYYKIIFNILNSIKINENYINEYMTDDKIYNKFYSATIRDYNKLNNYVIIKNNL